MWRDKDPGSFQRVVEQALATLLAAVVAYVFAVALGYLSRPDVQVQVAMSITTAAVWAVVAFNARSRRRFPIHELDQRARRFRNTIDLLTLLFAIGYTITAIAIIATQR